MKTRAIFLLFLSFLSFKIQAQQIFVPNGKITFEKKINMQRSLTDWDIPDEAKEKMKKYRTSEWELLFDQTRSLYKAKKKSTENDNTTLFFSSGGSTNELYTNYGNKTRVLKKNIMGDDYLLNDTIPGVHWKIMQEVRNISGYECRKAIGVINDTVYVVAFYTDEILLKGGPEGFNGLPGMILGIAIPRYNTTWFATKIEGFAKNNDELLPPFKGIKTETEKELQELIGLFSRYSGNKSQDPEDIKKQLYSFTL